MMNLKVVWGLGGNQWKLAMTDEQKPAKSESTRMVVEAIEALCALAAMNVPRNLNIRLSVEGGRANGSISVPYYELLTVIRAWRAA
jgi:hypothetical protein